MLTNETPDELLLDQPSRVMLSEAKNPSGWASIELDASRCPPEAGKLGMTAVISIN